MKTRVLKSLGLVMTAVMLLSACGQPQQESKEAGESVASDVKEDVSEEQSSESEKSPYPEYLNLDSSYPIIKEGYEDTINIKVYFRDNTPNDWEDLWLSYYLDEKYNIQLDVQMVSGDAVAEQKSLMLNSGELPDMIWNFGVTNSEIVKYGVGEGLFLPLDQYINETLTPNIYSLFQDDNVRGEMIAPDGHIYSLPMLNDASDAAGYHPRFQINEKWLKDLGLEVPRTLDDFIDAMYALKEADPSEVGSENFYPLGGGADTTTAATILLNAFGYLTNVTSYGEMAAIRDGEVVIPAYDVDVFQEYLKLMNQFYNDGIIMPNYYTTDSTEVNAILLEGRNAVFGAPVYVSGVENWSDWGACYPLTSDWQEEPEQLMRPLCRSGNFLISADTEYPEICMRLADTFFDNKEGTSKMYWGGVEGCEWDSDEWVMLEWDEEGQKLFFDAEKYPEGYSSYTFRVECMYGEMLYWGTYDTYAANVEVAKMLGGDLPEERVDDVTTQNGHFCASMRERALPYVTTGFPNQYYLSEEDVNKLTDLETVIQPYIKEQVALFITGERALSEVNDFAVELESIGIKELLGMYQVIYDNSNK